MDIKKLPVFPAADIFPMMAKDDLAELAEDIKVNGLREPVVVADVDGKPMLVDGRNRRAACDIAKIKPEYRTLNGEDLNAFVISMNIRRRHMTKGQQAMAVAMVYPEPEKGGRGKKSSKIEEFKIASGYLSEARTVLSKSREMAQAVIAGSMSLKAAYDETVAVEGKIKNSDIRMRKLNEDRPDLAEHVLNEAMTLDDAIAKAKADAEELKQLRWAFTRNIVESIRPLDREPGNAYDDFSHFDASVADQSGEKITPARLLRASKYLAALAEAMETVK